jgi:Ca-activated chloride channel family protein
MKLPNLKLFISAILVVTAACLPGAAQEPAVPSSSPREMKMSLIVTDEKHHSLGELNQADIQIKEDGKPRTLTGLTKEAKPIKYVLLMDNSLSFKKFLNGIIMAASLLIDQNKAGDETELVRFVSSDKINVQLAFTSDQAKLKETVAKETHLEEGQSAVIDALYLTVDQLSQTKPESFAGRQAVVLISDGEDRNSYYSEGALVKLLRLRNVQVFVLGMTNQLDDVGGQIIRSPKEKAERLLNLVALESGGRSFFPKTVGELQRATNEIAHDLRVQFVLSYSAPAEPLKNGFHKVEVKIADGKKLTAVTRPGFLIAPPNEKDKKKSP